jgi:hypothetical protein
LLKFSDLVIGVKQSGEFAGSEYLELKALRDKKAHTLSLSNPTLRNDVGFHDMVAHPEDPLCIVKVFKAYREHFPEDYEGPFLRRPKPLKAVRKELGTNRIRAQQGEPAEFIMMANLSEKGKFGKNYPSQICDEVAKMVGLVDSRGTLHCCVFLCLATVFLT